ncbi:MAG: membrane dipeptidase [Anaerolineae bacterium]|nr:membrane dipeptidase [Anaerolineae bacterium]
MAAFIIDAHLDMAYNAIVLGRDLRRPVEEIRNRERQAPPPGRHTGTCLVTIPALRKGRIAIVGGSLFVAPAWKRWSDEPQVYHTAEEAHIQAQAQLDNYHRWADELPDVQLLRDRGDLDTVLISQETETPRLGIFVVMEGAAPIRTPDELGMWVERGLRGVGLTWAAGTPYAGGNANPGPLTDLGQALLHEMANFNLLLDISHLWEAAAYDALHRYPGPVGASHANPRAFVDSPRQLSDTLIRLLAERDGVMGIVPFNLFLQAGWTQSEPRLPLTRVVEAIDYTCQLVGSARHVGLGSDFDGGLGLESVPAEIGSIADLGKIETLLGERGYAPDDITAILHGNWLRLMRQVLDAF